jgi:hypothetical protein
MKKAVIFSYRAFEFLQSTKFILVVIVLNQERSNPDTKADEVCCVIIITLLHKFYQTACKLIGYSYLCSPEITGYSKLFHIN